MDYVGGQSLMYRHTLYGNGPLYYLNSQRLASVAVKKITPFIEVYEKLDSYPLKKTNIYNR